MSDKIERDSRKKFSDLPANTVLKVRSLLQKIEAGAHGHCDGARERGKAAPGIREIVNWAAEASSLLADDEGYKQAARGAAMMKVV